MSDETTMIAALEMWRERVAICEVEGVERHEAEMTATVGVALAFGSDVALVCWKMAGGRE